METLKSFCISILMIGLLLIVGTDLSADEQRVEVIDKTNWIKAEGFVPDCLLDWVKQGRYVLAVGKVNYDVLEFYPGYAKESFTANVGRYELNEQDIIVDAKTKELAKEIVGFPFPAVDPNDPKAAIKIIYNKQYVTYILGFKKFTTMLAWVGANTGYEREIDGFYRDAYFIGFPGAKEYENPKDIERYSIISVRAPYDLAGTSIMLWRYLTDKPDVNFAYLPAIRRVRRSTPANRSDGFVGSDFAVDDILAYDGKIPAFEWKLIGKREALVPFVGPDPIGVEITEKDEWKMSEDRPYPRYAYEDKDSRLDPWSPINCLYVKRPVWIVQAKSKDPYYNYGIQYIWVLEDTWGPAYKIVHDRSNNFWKFMSVSTSGFQTVDGGVKFLAWLDHVIIDPRRNHATIIKLLGPGAIWVANAVLDLNDFSLAGFQKYCK